MRVEPKAIVRRLNSTCTAFLEAAVGQAAGGRFYEIVPEHLLLAVLSGEDCDARALLTHAEQDLGRLRGRVQRVLDQMRTGSAGRPVFAESVFQWLEDAWVLASLHFGANEIRSGHLLLMYVSLGHRYSAEAHPELRTLSVEALKRDFEAITAGTKEAALAVASAPAGQPAAVSSG
jgi:type VI secretion system protein VasG